MNTWIKITRLPDKRISYWHFGKMPWYVSNKYIAITFGNRVYCKYKFNEVVRTIRQNNHLVAVGIQKRYVKLIRHEFKHIDQYQNKGKIGFWISYFWQYASSGFSYRKIKLEEEARKAELDTSITFRVG